jgi:hypothetical protein
LWREGGCRGNDDQPDLVRRNRRLWLGSNSWPRERAQINAHERRFKTRGRFHRAVEPGDLPIDIRTGPKPFGTQIRLQPDKLLLMG